jgi:hypothetical protein
MEARACAPEQRPLQNRHERLRPAVQVANPVPRLDGLGLSGRPRAPSLTKQRGPVRRLPPLLRSPTGQLLLASQLNRLLDEPLGALERAACERERHRHRLAALELAVFWEDFSGPIAGHPVARAFVEEAARPDDGEPTEPSATPTSSGTRSRTASGADPSQEGDSLSCPSCSSAVQRTALRAE